MRSPAGRSSLLAALFVLALVSPSLAGGTATVLQRLGHPHKISGLTPGTVAKFRERKLGPGFYIRYGSGAKVGSLQVYEAPLTLTSAELRDATFAKILRFRPRRVETTPLESGDWTNEFGDSFATMHFRTVHTRRRKRQVEKREVDEYLFARSSGDLGIVVRYATESGEGSRAEAERFAADLVKLMQ